MDKYDASKALRFFSRNVLSNSKNTLYMKKLINILLTVSLLISCSDGNIKENKEFFVFKPDIRLFTTYAFMNAAGFSHDWNEKMHPIRIEIRNHLDTVLDNDYKNKIGDY